MTGKLDPQKITALRDRELAAFLARIPQSLALSAKAAPSMPNAVPMSWMAWLVDHPPIWVTSGQGSRFQDVDGNSYIDFNLADLSNTIGYGENAVSRCIAQQAARGIQYLLPGEDAIAVCQELHRRTGFPQWQFTLSASQTNVEIIRIARAMTGRLKIVLFEGKYHGHIDTTLAHDATPQAMGLSPAAVAETIVVPFNDPAALQAALAAGDVALVMTEPALTNCTLVLPDPGFLATVQSLCRQHGTLFALDETHTWQFAFGGLARGQDIEADFLCLGKGLGTGAAFAFYGMRADVGRFVESHAQSARNPRPGLALGGTLFGSALTVAAARAGLEEIMTEAGYDRITRLGSRLADGIEALIARHALPWCSLRCGPRAGFCLSPQPPRNRAEAAPSLDPAFSAARRLFMANRGIWEAISSAAPQVSFAHDEADIDHYLDVAGAFLDAVVAK